ncbi:hypothetical protein NDU88_009782 [Pleurodeles waltl]|uniref:Uncharacterized protein n=1 Tax=Pleurodeles waltl TaxID=8319 RepID=A0AAV7PTT3_PLEWA|nr:hypothetical protein NDU88_009782 [Pleurodeles waltl]
MRRRSRNNDYASKRRRARKVSIHVGDMVLVKDHHPGGKLCLPFEGELWTVTAINGTMITATRDSESVTRNISQIKKFLTSPSSDQARAGSVDNTLVNVRESAAFSLASPRQAEPSTVEDVVPGQDSLPRQILPAVEEATTMAEITRNPSNSQEVPAGRSRGGRFNLRSNPGHY